MGQPIGGKMGSTRVIFFAAALAHTLWFGSTTRCAMVVAMEQGARDRDGAGTQATKVATIPDDVRLLFDTIETLQQPIEDFRCEFEGDDRLVGQGVGKQKLMDGGFVDMYSGVFVRKQNGNTYCEIMKRIAPDGMLEAWTFVVDAEAEKAERYIRMRDGDIGSGAVSDPAKLNRHTSGQYGYIYPMDQIRQWIVQGVFQPNVTTDRMDGREFKVLELRVKERPENPFARFWIDLNRTGHVVRAEYWQGDKLGSRLDIQLAEFDVGGTKVWMPVSGDSIGYVKISDTKPLTAVTLSEPTSRAQIRVLKGTMQFNQHPGPEVFTIRYKPGTPISDELKKMRYEYGAQKLPAEPTNAEMEKMLKDSIADAEKQKKELVARPSEGIDWIPWVQGGAAVCVVIALGIWWKGRRGS
jgi:hypothetical protein